MLDELFLLFVKCFGMIDIIFIFIVSLIYMSNKFSKNVEEKILFLENKTNLQELIKYKKLNNKMKICKLEIELSKLKAKYELDEC